MALEGQERVVHGSEDGPGSRFVTALTFEGQFLTRTRSGYSRATMPMKIIKSYSTRVEADLARIALEAADVPSVVVGLGVNMDGGTAGVQLLVPDDQVEAAMSVLGDA